MRALIILFLLFSFSLTTAGQDTLAFPKHTYEVEVVRKKSAIIVYDFNNKLYKPADEIYQMTTKAGKTTYRTVQKLWFGKRVNLQIKINPYLYDVYVGHRQVDDKGPVDSTAARYFTSSLITLAENRIKVDSITKTKSQEPEAKEITEVKDNMAEAIKASKGEEKTIEETLRRFDSFNAFTAAIDSGTLGIKDIKLISADKKDQEKLKEEFEQALEEKRKYEEYKARRTNFYKELDVFFNASNALQKNYDLCENAVLLCLKDKLNAAEIVGSVNAYLRACGQPEIDIFTNAFPKIVSDCTNGMNTAYNNLQIAFANLKGALFTSKYYNNINITEDQRIMISSDTIYAKYNRLKPDVFVKTFFLLIKNLANEESFVHTDPTRLTVRDTLVYTIEIKPSARFESLINQYGIKLYNKGTKFDYYIPVKGNFKVNFSIGAAFMFNSLRPKDYFFSSSIANLPEDSSQVMIVEKKSGNNFIPAIAAYAHGYIKLGGWFTPAVSIGLSTNPTDFSNASYFLGASLICGQQSRFIFTLGRAGTSSTVLRSKYDLKKTYYKKDFLNTQETDLTTKAFRSGWFLGVSYNISSNR